MLKKLVTVLAATSILCIPAFAVPHSCFVISPLPGVTGDQLSQARITQILENTQAYYQYLLDKADAQYQQVIASLHLDPNCDHSGDTLNKSVAEAVAAREAAYDDAELLALHQAQEACQDLCLAELDTMTGK